MSVAKRGCDCVMAAAGKNRDRDAPSVGVARDGGWVKSGHPSLRGGDIKNARFTNVVIFCSAI